MDIIWKDLKGFKDGNALDLLSGELENGRVLLVLGEDAPAVLDIFSLEAGHEGSLQLSDGQSITNKDVKLIREWKRPLLKTLTVQEHVSFPSCFLMEQSELQQRLEMILDTFDLAKIRGTKVENISSQQQKIILIASKLTIPPKLAVLHDPFEDMQKTDAVNLMASLTKYANNTRCPIIISAGDWTMQQQIAEMADKVLLVGGGGKGVFVGNIRDAIAHVADGYDVAALMNAISLDYSSWNGYRQSLDRINRLYHSWQDHINATRQPQVIGTTPTSPRGQIEATGISGWQKFRILTWRFRTILLRDRASLLALTIQIFLPFALLSFLFFRKSAQTLEELLMIRVPFFFLLTVNNTFSVTIPVSIFFRSHVWLIEADGRSYNPVLALAAKIAVIIPFRLLLTAIFAIPIYYITGLRTDSFYHILIFVGYLLLNTLASIMIGMAVGAWTPSVEITQLVIVLALDVYILFGGLGSSGHRPSWILRWIQYLSPIFYTFRGLIQNEVRGQFSNQLQNQIGANQITMIWSAGGLLLISAFYFAISLGGMLTL